MAKICDNKSVGIIIKDGDRYALIKRINYPVSFAFVAGHVDDDSFEDAAKKEVMEEVRVKTVTLKLVLDKQFPNPCKRQNGSYHPWQVFEAVAWAGELHAGSDAKEAFWISQTELKMLAKRTHDIAERLGVSRCCLR